MKNRFSLIFATALSLLVFFSCNKTGNSGSGEKVQLSMNLKPGLVHKIHYTMDQTVTQKMMGMSQKIGQTTEVFIRQEVESVDEQGIATVKVTYERVKASMENAFMGKQSYDSDKDDKSSAMAGGFGMMAGKTFKMMVDKQSRIVDVEGIEELMEGVWEGMEMEDDDVNESMKKAVGPEAMKNNLQQMALVFPDVLVGVGDTWGHNYELAGEFGLGAETTYKVEHIDGDKMILAVESEVKTREDAKIEMGAMAVNYNISGDQSGTLELDRKTGLVQRSELNQDLKGEVKAQGMTMPMTISSKFTIEPY